MKYRYLSVFLVLAFLSLLMAGSVVLAQTSANFNLEWHVIGSADRVTSSADYRVDGTFGQGIASPPTSNSAGFVVSSGYWFVGTGQSGTIGPSIFLPILLKN